MGQLWQPGEAKPRGTQEKLRASRRARQLLGQPEVGRVAAPLTLRAKLGGARGLLLSRSKAGGVFFKTTCNRVLPQLLSASVPVPVSLNSKRSRPCRPVVS